MIALKQGVCALCREEKELELSHTIPKFSIRRLKKTSFGNIRCVENPNRVVQDSEKEYLLCSDCEDRFSTVETKFANKIFHPYLNGDEKVFEYSNWLSKFIVSISWRSLYLDILNWVRSGDLDINSLDILIKSENIMRDYLLGKRDNIGSIENHIFFYDDVVSANKEIAELQPNSSFHRSQVSYTSCYSSAQTYATISNLMGICIISLYKKGKEEKWENTEINLEIGKIKAENQYITSVIGDDFTEILKDINESKKRLSGVQQDKINDKINRDKEGFKESKFSEEYLKDKNIRISGGKNSE